MKIGAATMCSVLGLFAATPAFAADVQSEPSPAPSDQQAAEPPAQDDSFGDIVVTANRRAEPLQKVGIAITALTGEQMEARGLTNASEIAAVTPNYQVVRSYAAPGYNTQVTIRGVGQPNFEDTTEATATSYVDEFYLIGAGQADFLLFDLVRTEVARGPQGTVQGRNSTAGSINFYTKRPDTEAVEGNISLAYGSHNQIKTSAILNVPISDSVAIRGGFTSDNSDGYVRNINPQAVYRRAGANDFKAGRLQLLIKPSEDFSFNIKGEFGRLGPVTAQNEKAFPVGAVPGLPGTYRLPTDVFGQNQQNTGAGAIDVTNADGAYELANRIDHVLGTVNWNLSERTSLVAFVGWLKSRKYEIEDCDHTPLPICQFGNDSRSEHWIGEARISHDAGAFRVTAGGNYLHQDLNVAGLIAPFFNSAISPVSPNLLSEAYLDEQTLSSYAIFGQAEYDLSDQLTLIAGARYTKDDKKIDSFDAFSVSVPGTTAVPRTIEDYRAIRIFALQNPAATTLLNPSVNGELARFDKGLVNLNVQLNWKPSNNFLGYAAFRRGTKSGGFITGFVNGVAPALRPYQEETNNAYELGFKSTILGGKARLNGAAFVYDYKDMQNTSFIGLTNVVTNNDAKVYGAELELNANPFPGMTVTGGIGVLDTKVDGISNPTGSVPILSDNELPMAPSFTGNLLLRYEWSAFGGTMFVQGSGTGRTSMWRDSLNNPSIKIPGLFTADASVGYKSDSGWSLTAAATNIFDTRRIVNAFDASSLGNSGEVIYHKPRWFLSTLSFSF